MSASCEIVVNPVTFQPVAVLKVNGKRLPIEITIEQAQDKKFDETDFLLMLLDEQLSDDEVVHGYNALRKKFLKPTK